jgi:hypothetical protein
MSLQVVDRLVLTSHNITRRLQSRFVRLLKSLSKYLAGVQIAPFPGRVVEEGIGCMSSKSKVLQE